MSDVRVVRKHDEGCKGDEWIVAHSRPTAYHPPREYVLPVMCRNCPAEVLVSERAVVQLAEQAMRSDDTTLGCFVEAGGNTIPAYALDHSGARAVFDAAAEVPEKVMGDKGDEA